MLINTSPQTYWFAIPALFFFAACTSSDELGFDNDKQDGYTFVRDLEPVALDLNNGVVPAKFNTNKYIAHEFQIDSAQEVNIFADFSWKQDLENIINVTLNTQLSYSIDYVFFSYNDSNPKQPWDLYRELPASWGLDSTIDLQAGRYMVLTLGSPEAYEDEAEIFLEFSITASENRAPGSMEIRAITHDGQDATDMRIAMGNQSGYTDTLGRVTLIDIPSGLYAIKFGEDGLGRSETLPENRVIGDNLLQKRVIVISPSQYEEWRRR